MEGRGVHLACDPMRLYLHPSPTKLPEDPQGGLPKRNGKLGIFSKPLGSEHSEQLACCGYQRCQTLVVRKRKSPPCALWSGPESLVGAFLGTKEPSLCAGMPLLGP